MIAQIDTSGLELKTTGVILMENTIESSGRFAKVEQDSTSHILPIFSQASLSKRDATVGFHTHPGIELIYFSAGKASVFIGAQEYFCQAETLFVIPPELSHNQICRGESTNSFIVFLASQELFDSSFRQLDVSDAPWIGRLFSEVCLLSEETHYGLCSGVLFSLLRAISDFEKQKHRLAGLHPALCLAVDYIEEHFQQAVSMETLAGRCAVSYTYLRKLFKVQFGLSPSRYLQNYRMAHARRQLLNSNLTVSEVGNACGYMDANYFSRLFHKVHHCTPGEYRQVVSQRPDDSFIRM